VEHGTVAGQLLCTYDWIAIQFKDCELKAQLQPYCEFCANSATGERDQRGGIDRVGMPVDNNVAPSQFTVSGIAIIYLNRLTG